MKTYQSNNSARSNCNRAEANGLSSLAMMQSKGQELVAAWNV